MVQSAIQCSAAWVRRCFEAWRSGEVETVVALFPARTDLKAFHECVSGYADVLFVPGRIDFEDEHGRDRRSPLACMVVVWGGTPAAAAAMAAKLWCVHLPCSDARTSLVRSGSRDIVAT